MDKDAKIGNNCPVKIVNVHGHWEVHDKEGRFIVSGDTQTEALLSYHDILDEFTEREVDRDDD